MAKKYQFEYDEAELMELKQLLKKLASKEPKVEVKLNGYIRGLDRKSVV